ncbi:hypothetical protein KSF_051390 [Reticulibacter mediterranei]|uniref:Uncharacterized protein n=1 Tax=Reticulibacter mediterranei TaxID=2778369 RepID=A0A8J3ITM5_9CHLR|nr:hypothetical protein KSF_051390 [Reticulibacter mediterranei]
MPTTASNEYQLGMGIQFQAPTRFRSGVTYRVYAELRDKSLHYEVREIIRLLVKIIKAKVK